MSSTSIKNGGGIGQTRLAGRLGWPASTCLFLGLGTMASTWAEDRSVGPAEGVALDEVIVTAQRRTENLQKTAIAITAISGDEIRDSGKETLDSVLRNVPGLAVQNTANGGQIFIRGVGSNADPLFGDPAVNLNIDGVYQQEAISPLSILFDVNRLEVLRGPQGTLYGRNATAGSINVITNDPQDHLAASGTVQFGNYNDVHTEGMVNVPVNSAVALRAAFATQRRDGYLSNGNDDADFTAARMKALVQPNDALRLVVTGDYVRQRGSGRGSVYTSSLHPDDPWQSTLTQGLIDYKTWSLRAQLDVSMDWATLTVLPAHLQTTSFDNNELIAPLAGAGIQAMAGRNTENSLEMRLTSPTESWLKWVGGAYYLRYKQDVEANPVSRIGTAQNGGVPTGVNYDTNDTESYALFGQATIPMGESLRFTAGARYTSDNKVVDFREDTAGAAGGAALSYDKTWTSTNYKVGVEADVAAASMLYGQVSTGFKSGGFDQQFPAVAYNPEKLTAFQVGSKNRFFAERLQVNAEAFYYDYKDYQAQFPFINTTTGVFFNRVANAGSAKIKGAELEAVAQLTPHDRVNINAAYLDGKFGAFTYDTNVPPPLHTVDHSDEIMPNSPKWSGLFGYEHRFDLPNGGDITFSGNIRYYAKYWTSVERLEEQDAYHKSEASLAYNAPGDTWRIGTYIKNIENEAVKTFALGPPVPGIFGVMVAAPRTYGVIFSASF